MNYTCYNMDKIEMFRISPEINKYYEYAEYTYKEGKWPNERYFVTGLLQYVGLFIRRVEGGYCDNNWRIDYFQNENCDEIEVHYSYEGKTCFREVPCKLVKIPSLSELLIKYIVKNINY